MTDTLRTALQQMREALAEAREDVDHWASYAGDYFRKKHALAGNLARLDAAIAIADAALAASQPAAAPQPVALTDMALVRLWGDRSDGPDNREIVSFGRAVLAAAPPPAAAPQPVAEPLFLLHCGQIDSGGEQDDWDVEANSGKAVEAFAALHPGRTIGLYAAPPPAAAPGWTAVKDGYPASDAAPDFFVYDENDPAAQPFIAEFYDNANGKGFGLSTGRCTVTHWMPIVMPAAPGVPAQDPATPKV